MTSYCNCILYWVLQSISRLGSFLQLADNIHKNDNLLPPDKPFILSVDIIFFPDSVQTTVYGNVVSCIEFKRGKHVIQNNNVYPSSIYILQALAFQQWHYWTVDVMAWPKDLEGHSKIYLEETKSKICSPPKRCRNLAKWERNYPAVAVLTSQRIYFEPRLWVILWHRTILILNVYIF